MKPDAARRGGIAGQTGYSVHGIGEPLVLVHGVGMNREIWEPQVAHFARDHQVVVYDMLGHGQSAVPAEGVALGDYALQLAGLLDHLGIAAAHVAGHSMGALVALEFALSFPERAHSVAALNAVFLRSPEQRAAVVERAATLRHTGVAPTVEPTIGRWFGEPVPVALKATAAKVARMLKEVDPLGYARTYQLFASSDAVHADRLASLRMPVCYMTGEFDPNSSPAMAREMARRTPGSALDILPDARHMMPVTHPDAVNLRLRKFLESVPG